MADFRKPLDRTGKASSNKIVGEAQTLVNRQVRTAVPDFGAFFTESLKITDAATGYVLQKGVDYSPADLYPIPTREYGKEICASIVIYNTTVSNNIILDYQALGGGYSNNRKNIFAALDAMDLDDRPVKYEDLVARPWFLNPGPHQHDTDDTYGWEYITRQLDGVMAGMAQGRQATYDKIRADLDREYQSQLDHNAALKLLLQQHVSDFNNPHQLYAGQINVYTKQETDAILSALYTEFTNRGNSIISTMLAHDSNKSNPHGVTPGQINAYTTAEFQAKLADAIKRLSAGSDGQWVYLFSGTPGRPDPTVPDNPTPRSSWSWTNPYSKAVVVSNTMAGQGNQGVCQEAYVNGSLISLAYNTQSSDSDNKSIQGLYKVPAGGSITIYSNMWQSYDFGDGGYNSETCPPGRFLTYAWVPKGA
jgi:hypothetical protein